METQNTATMNVDPLFSTITATKELTSHHLIQHPVKETAAATHARRLTRVTVHNPLQNQNVLVLQGTAPVV